MNQRVKIKSYAIAFATISLASACSKKAAFSQDTDNPPPTGNNITVNVTVDSAGNAKTDSKSGMDGDKAKALGYMVSQAVQQELVEQKRPGGLLSQY